MIIFTEVREGMVDPVADLLLHPVRMRILMSVARGEMTAQQLAEVLEDVPQATLYRHLSKMVQGNILQIVEERPNRGTVEKVYAAVKEHSHVTAEELANSSKETMMRLFTSYLVGLLADYAHYLEQEKIDPLSDGLSFTQIPLFLTQEELAKMFADLRQPLVTALENKPEEGRRLRLFNLIVVPEPDKKQNS